MNPFCLLYDDAWSNHEISSTNKFDSTLFPLTHRSQLFRQSMDDDDNTHRFSSGLELANFIATSDLLQHSWKAITKVRSEIVAEKSICSAFHGFYNKRSNCKIIAFVTTPNCTKNPVEEEEGGEDLVSISDLQDEFTAFEFLCSKGCSASAINGCAVFLFRRCYHLYEQLILGLISNPNTQLIITGHGLGGWVASLFTLLLLDLLDLTKSKRPLCITFGCPLLGNESLQKAISDFSTWSSCFLHVVSNHDPLPTTFLSTPYYPFGTFLFCSESGGCVCSEDPKSIFKLLEATAVRNTSIGSLFDYKETIDSLINQVNLVATSDLITENTESLRGCFIAQIDALGIAKNQAQQSRITDVNRLATFLINAETDMIFEKTKASEPSKTLNDRKIMMAYLEWYKKKCKSDNIGYYDSYKNASHEPDIRVAEFKKVLRVYWESTVENVKRRPQKEGAPFVTRWLLGGTNYRRMIEPLDIAEHYRKGLNNYEKHRPEHYKKLEEWLGEWASNNTSSGLQKETVSSILTIDSCFWAHVEEAVLECKVVKMVDCSERDKEKALAKLANFEEYVVELMKIWAVSSEIFLPLSSFMKWWKEYDEIVGDDHDSVLTRIMRNGQYEEYADGRLEIH